MLGYLEQQGYDHQLICTEAGDLDLALFTKHVLNPLNPIPIIEQLLAIPDIQALVQQVGADGRVTDDERKQVAYALKSNPDSRPVLERYQAEGLTKRVAITLGSGVSQFYWGSIQDYPVEESPDWYHIIMWSRNKPEDTCRLHHAAHIFRRTAFLCLRCFQGVQVCQVAAGLLHRTRRQSPLPRRRALLFE